MRPEQRRIRLAQPCYALAQIEVESSPKVIWGVVKDACSKCDVPGVAPHDLRRYAACGIVDERARACVTRPVASWNRFSFCWGHVSVETTERYLGCKQRFRNAVNDRIGIEPD
jgi:integrase